MKDARAAFLWIVDILKKRDITFQVTGGLAAKSYGSPRPLNDIDIDIQDKDFGLILPDIKDHIIFGPDRYRNEVWDLDLITLSYNGQEIDISGGTTLRLMDLRTGKWVSCPTDFSRCEYREIFGVKVPVITKEDLIKYKSMLIGKNVGEHQRIDIESIS